MGVSRKKFLNRKILIQQRRLKQRGEGGLTLFKRLYRVHLVLVVGVLEGAGKPLSPFAQ